MSKRKKPGILLLVLLDDDEERKEKRVRTSWVRSWLGRREEIVLECCQAIVKILGPIHIKTPDNQEKWSTIAKCFLQRWNIPNGIGAIDGKIIVQQPFNSGSHYYDYKDNNSIILVAVFGPNYECLWADIGTNGRAPVGAIWQKSDFKNLLSSSSNPLSIPPPAPLPGKEMPVPYVLTGDNAFGLTRYLIKPYPRTHLSSEQRIFNYRLSRMRHISENGFGILANQWRLLRSPILLSPASVKKNSSGCIDYSQFYKVGVISNTMGANQL